MMNVDLAEKSNDVRKLRFKIDGLSAMRDVSASAVPLTPNGGRGMGRITTPLWGLGWCDVCSDFL